MLILKVLANLVIHLSLRECKKGRRGLREKRRNLSQLSFNTMIPNMTPSRVYRTIQ